MILKRKSTYCALLVTLFAFVLIATPAWADAKLSVQKTADANQVAEGQVLTYTIEVSNVGDKNATGVVLKDTLPPNTTLVSTDSSVGTPCTGTSPVSCSLGTLEPGDSATVTIQVQPTSAAVGKVIQNQATATSNGGKVSASDTLNTTVTPDLSITKNASRSSVKVGDRFTYTLTVQDAGQANATNVIVVDALLDEVTYVYSNTTQGSCALQTNNVVQCNLGNLNSGATATVKILVRANQEGTITNKAGVFVKGVSNPIDVAQVSTTVTTNKKKNHNGGNNNNNNNNQYNGNNENEDDNQYSDNGSASINSEATTSSGNQYEDTFGNGGARASVGPEGSRAQAGGANAGRSPDQYAPETGPRGDVVNEVPTEGPLPNTGGLSLLAVILPIAGFLILSAAIITRIRNSR